MTCAATPWFSAPSLAANVQDVAIQSELRTTRPLKTVVAEQALLQSSVGGKQLRQILLII